MPTPITTDAIVLRILDYSDTSLIARLFTEEHGKVTVIAKGARRPKQGIAGILQPPNHVTVWYSHKDGRDIQTLTKLDFVERYPQLSASLTKSAAALVIAEMLDRAVHDSDPHPILFRLITSTLRHLDQAEANEAVILHFYQLHLAKQLGFGPQLASCSQCGRALIDASLDPDTGSLLCTRCQPVESVSLDKSALDHLRDLSKTHISDLLSIAIGGKTGQEVEHYLLNHLYYHVDGMSNLQSIKFWRQVTT